MKRALITSIQTLLLCSAIFNATAAHAEIRLEEKVPFFPDLKIGKLPNGLTYYIQKTGGMSYGIEMRLVVKTGSIMEDDDQKGLAHFVEHMAFDGSTHFKKKALVSFLESIGMKMGSDLNAATGPDQTIYRLTLPGGKKENLERGLLVLSDWAGGVSFDPEEMEKERGVVFEEMRLRSGAGFRLWDLTMPKILENSRYPLRPVASINDNVVMTAKRDVVTRFYKDWYRPDLMAVVVVGGLDPVEAEQQIKNYFEKMQNPENERPRDYAQLPARTKPGAVVAIDKEATQNSVRIIYDRHLDLDDQTFGHIRKIEVERMFSAMLRERLKELARLPDPPFIDASIGIGGSLARGYRELSAQLIIGKSGPAVAIAALNHENQRLLQFGFTTTELDRARQNIFHVYEHASLERSKRTNQSFADEIIRNFLIDESIPGNEPEFNIIKELLPTITLEELNQFAKTTLTNAHNPLIIYTGSDQAEYAIPTEAGLLAMLAAADTGALTVYEDKASNAVLMEQAPAGGTIVSEKTSKSLGTTELTLGNGVIVVLKETGIKKDQVLMRATRAGGTSLFSDADIANARYASTIIQEMGVKDFSPNDLRKMFAGKTVSVSPFISPLNETIIANSDKAGIETMLQLTHLYFTQPRKDEALFASFINKRKAATKDTHAQPETIFYDAELRARYNKHPRAPYAATPAEFDKISLDRSMAIYKERFSSAKGFKFFLVGSFDMATIKPLVAAYLGTLPGDDVPATFKDVGMRQVKGRVNVQEHAGLAQQSRVQLTLRSDAQYSIGTELKFQAMVDVLQLKITARLREQMGAVYSPHVRSYVEKFPQSFYQTTMTLPCGPENVDRLIKASFAEIQDLKDNGVSDIDLNKVKENRLKTRQQELNSNEFWIRELYWSAANEEDPIQILTYKSSVDALTKADLQEAAKAYLDTDNVVQAVLYPQTNPPEKIKAKAK